MVIFNSDSPERNLIAAIIIRAIIDLHSNWPDEVADARAWLTGLTVDPEGISFEQACMFLDLDPDVTLIGALNPKKAMAGPCRGLSLGD